MSQLALELWGGPAYPPRRSRPKKARKRQSAPEDNSLAGIRLPVQPILGLISRTGGVKAAARIAGRRYRSEPTWERALWRLYNDNRAELAPRCWLTVGLIFADELCSALGTHLDLIFTDADYSSARCLRLDFAADD